MALINQIDSGLVAGLSSSSSSSSSGSSTINGIGAGASFGGDSVSLSASINSVKDAFSRSVVRLNDAVAQFEIAGESLNKLFDITTELISLTEKSFDTGTSDEERNRLNSVFQRRVADFREVLDDAERNGIDLLDKDDLADILDYAGIARDQATTLSEAFSEIAGVDGTVGFASIFSTEPDPAVTENTSTSGYREQVLSDEANTSGATGVFFGTIVEQDYITQTRTDQILVGSVGDYLGENGSNQAAIVEFTEDEEGATEVDIGTLGVNEVEEFYAASQSGKYVLMRTQDPGGLSTTDGVSLLNRDTGSVSLIQSNRFYYSEDADLSADGTKAIIVGYDTQLPGRTTYADIKLVSNVTGSPSTISIGATNDGDFEGEVKAADSGVLFRSRSASLGGDGITFELLYRDGYTSMATYTSITSNARSEGYDIDYSGNIAAYITNDASRSLHFYAISTTSDNDTGLDDVYDVALNDDGTRAAVLMDNESGERVIRRYDTSNPKSMSLLDEVNVEGLSASDLSITADGESIGYSKLVGGMREYAIYARGVTTSTRVEPAEVPSGNDPLEQDISTRANAAVAKQTLEKLYDEIETDLEGVETVIEELRGALNFALQGFQASSEINSRIISYSTADQVATDLVSKIQAGTSDPFLAAHSNLDTQLAADLLNSDN